MSLRNAIYARAIADADLYARVVKRVYFTVADAAHGSEYIVVHVISDDPESHMTGAAGFTTERVQFDCWAKTPGAADEIADLVREAFDGFSGTMGAGDYTETVSNCYRVGGSDDYEASEHAKEYGMFCRKVDYMITHTETIPVHA